MSGASRFVWHDLNTGDANGARRFYGELFGWRFEKSDNGPYEHIKAGEQMIGGVRQTAPNEQAPAHWLGYIGVEDVAASVAAATRHGGKVYMSATVMQGVGTFAVVADPTGARFAPWKSARTNEDCEPAGKPAPYTFCWDELLSPDAAASGRFYASVFGWNAEDVPMPGFKYTLLKRPGIKDETGADKSAAGIAQMPPDVPSRSAWLAYIAVPDADATVKAVTRLGGTITAPPRDIPGVGRFARAVDAQKVAFAFLAPPRTT